MLVPLITNTFCLRCWCISPQRSFACGTNAVHQRDLFCSVLLHLIIKIFCLWYYCSSPERSFVFGINAVNYSFFVFSIRAVQHSDVFFLVLVQLITEIFYVLLLVKLITEIFCPWYKCFLPQRSFLLGISAVHQRYLFSLVLVQHVKKIFCF